MPLFPWAWLIFLQITLVLYSLLTGCTMLVPPLCIHKHMSRTNTSNFKKSKWGKMFALKACRLESDSQHPHETKCGHSGACFNPALERRGPEDCWGTLASQPCLLWPFQVSKGR